MLQCLEPGGPHVVHLHGVAGVGKSSLLEAFAAEARRRGVMTARLDCRGVEPTEPTERGFLHELELAIGGDAATADEAADRLAVLGDRVVLALDNYEVFQLMDGWLRQVFAPALPDNVRLIIVGREPPAVMWLGAPGWYGLFQSLTLGPLAADNALDLLQAAGLTASQARRVNQLARGHPLALRLAAAAAAERPKMNLEDVALHRMIEELARVYLAEVTDPLTRRALEAASVVRRTTAPLLGAMLPEVAPLDAMERLSMVPFIESGRDGLIIHDAVQQAIAATLKGTEPERYREYRRRAWHELRSEVRHAGRSELWRYTADLLYLLENPEVREVFFPSGGNEVAIETASAADEPDVRAIAERYSGPSRADQILTWSGLVTGSLRLARSRQTAVAGFILYFDAEAASWRGAPDDPLVRSWSSHLQEHPMARGERAVFNVETLCGEHGEGECAVQASLWLDIKRFYMEQRPHLRRVYGATRDWQAYAPSFEQLNFQRFGSIEVDGETYGLFVLDMGPGSVYGWLAGLVAAELGIERDDDLLDVDAHELVLDGRRVALTQLEFGVMRYLADRPGKVVTRVALETEVWGYDYHGGSNVVDAVVRSLRKKLGDHMESCHVREAAGFGQQQV